MTLSTFLGWNISFTLLNYYTESIAEPVDSACLGTAGYNFLVIKSEPEHTQGYGESVEQPREDTCH